MSKSICFRLINLCATGAILIPIIAVICKPTLAIVNVTVLDHLNLFSFFLKPDAMIS